MGIFIFIIMAFIIVVFSAVFIYMTNTTEDQLHSTLGNMDVGGSLDVNGTIDDTFGNFTIAVNSLYWIAVFIIIAMMLGMLFGSYLVTTKPLFIIPHIFLNIIAVFVSVGVSNAYETAIATPTLASTFNGMIGANFILLNLPIITAVLGFVSAIITFSQLNKGQEYAIG